MDEKYTEVFTDGKPDKLNIASHVVGFARVVEQSSGESKVYAISAPFGIGKTFFCDKLKGVLEADSVPVATMNIWAMDVYEHPLIPILLKLQDFYKAGSGEKARSFPKIPTLLRLIKSGIAAIHVTAPMPNGALIELDGKNIVDTNEALRENTGGEVDIYTEYINIKSEIETIKVFLRTWAESFKDKPVVVIIDELDRCRPDYAVKTLETLKHFFDIPGFVFVLAFDEQQLKNSVQTLFGTDNFDGYKRKFINNSFLLPEPNRFEFSQYLLEKTNIKHYIEKIRKDKRELVFKLHGYNMMCHNFGKPGVIEACNKFNATQSSEAIIATSFTAYSQWFGFSLRQMEQVFDRLLMFVKQIANSTCLFSPDLAVLLVCLHEFDIEIFNGIRTNNGGSEKLFGRIKGTYDALHKGKENKLPTFPKNMDGLPDIKGYSSLMENETIKLSYNIDRFFWGNNDLSFLVGNVFLNNGDLISKDGNFDLKRFKETYFSKMDFLSHFE
ncbi:MAG: hypothetical protein IJ560_04375 [Alphaproteobacteria bacterium]|nr:hypothetical protein [Alphaproteobacteria bacterium]